jgi:hypothetical protein
VSRLLRRVLLLVLASFAGLAFVMMRPGVPADASCSGNTYSVADLSPCVAPPGATMTITLRRKLTPAIVVFRAVVAAGVPAAIQSKFSGGSGMVWTLPVPAQLCIAGGGKWDVSLIDNKGVGQGQIGQFTSDCRPGASATPKPVITVAPAPPHGGLGCVSTSGAVASISPCTGLPGTVIGVYPLRVLRAVPARLVFNQFLGSRAVGFQVLATIGAAGGKYTVAAPIQLCANPSGTTYQVLMVDAAGVNQGMVGNFLTDCRGVKNAPKPTPTPKKAVTPAPKKTATPAPKKTATPAPKKTATPAPKKTATPAPKKTATPAPKKTATPLPKAFVPIVPGPKPAPTMAIPGGHSTPTPAALAGPPPICLNSMGPYNVPCRAAPGAHIAIALDAKWGAGNRMVLMATYQLAATQLAGDKRAPVVLEIAIPSDICAANKGKLLQVNVRAPSGFPTLGLIQKFEAVCP